ncbi:arylesterase [Candidatus Kaiserbacteria bacterium]|nr:arylesterase [Candidatus Kaiserbacteria bacterium]
MKYTVYAIVVAAAILMYLLFSGSEITNYPPEGESIVAFGDSLVSGVGATKGNDFVSLLSQQINEPIINLGVPGETTRDALNRIDDVLALDPKVVILLFGGNDYLRKIPSEETFANLGSAIETMHESGAVVVLLGVRGGVIRDNFEDEYALLADTYNTAYVSNVLDGLFGNPQLMSDGIHPNDAGYAIIAERVGRVLEPIVRGTY